MDWKKILKKFGPSEKPRRSSESKDAWKKRIAGPEEPEEEGPVEVIPEGFIVWILSSDWREYRLMDGVPHKTRDDALNEIKDEALNIEGPGRPWTVEGDEYGGKLTVYDGPSIMISLPSYTYQIIPAGEKPDDNYNPTMEHELFSPQRTLNRLDNEPTINYDSKTREDWQ